MAEIHAAEERGPSGAMRLGRYLDRSRSVALALSVAGASSDAGYGTLELGVELQLPGNPSITPTLGGRAGLLVEEGFAGDVLEGSAGLAFRIGTDQWIRVGAQLGQHSDAAGPHAILVGYQAPL